MTTVSDTVYKHGTNLVSSHDAMDRIQENLAPRIARYQNSPIRVFDHGEFIEVLHTKQSFPFSYLIDSPEVHALISQVLLDNLHVNGIGVTEWHESVLSSFVPCIAWARPVHLSTRAPEDYEGMVCGFDRLENIMALWLDVAQKLNWATDIDTLYEIVISNDVFGPKVEGTTTNLSQARMSARRMAEQLALCYDVVCRQQTSESFIVNTTPVLDVFVRKQQDE